MLCLTSLLCLTLLWLGAGFCLQRNHACRRFPCPPCQCVLGLHGPRRPLAGIFFAMKSYISGHMSAVHESTHTIHRTRYKPGKSRDPWQVAYSRLLCGILSLLQRAGPLMAGSAAGDDDWRQIVGSEANLRKSGTSSIVGVTSTDMHSVSFRRF